MKNTIFIFILFVTTLSCKAQNNFITSSELTINDISVIGENISLITQNFGQPISIEPYFFEMENIEGEIYFYNGLLFYVINNKIDSFEISNENYSVIQQNIKVGANISILESIYPISYLNRKTDLLAITLSDFEMYLGIEYDDFNIIQKITLYSY